MRTGFPWPEQPPDVAPRPKEGWLRPDTARLLAIHLTDETRVVLEIGAWLGLSTRFIAERAPNANVITIDHWRGSPEQIRDVRFAPVLAVLYETFLVNCWKLRHRIVPVRMASVDGMHELARFGVCPDLIYIDGDHSYEAVHNDLLTALTLFPSAQVIGDDWDWPSVRAAVADICLGRNLAIDAHGTAWRLL